MAKQKNKVCPSCSTVFRARRDAKTCSERCRKRLRRAQITISQELDQLKDSAGYAIGSLASEVKIPEFQGGFVGDGAVDNTAGSGVATEENDKNSSTHLKAGGDPAPTDVSVSSDKPLSSPLSSASVDKRSIKGNTPVQSGAKPLPSNTLATSPPPPKESNGLTSNNSPSEVVDLPNGPVSSVAPVALASSGTPGYTSDTPEPQPGPKPVEPIQTSEPSVIQDAAIKPPAATPIPPDLNLRTGFNSANNAQNEEDLATERQIPPSEQLKAVPSHVANLQWATQPVKPNLPIVHNHHYYPSISLSAGRRLLDLGVILLVAAGAVLFVNFFDKQASRSQDELLTMVQGAGGLDIPQSKDAILSFNRDVVVGLGKKFTATGQVLIQNQTDSSRALSLQNAEGDDLLVADTLNQRIGIGAAPTGTATLQVAGDISSSAAIISTVGAYSLGSRGLELGGNLVCTAAGCTSSSPDIDTAGLAGLNANQTFLGRNIFRSDDSTTAFAIQNSSGSSSLFVADTSNDRVGIGLAPSATGATLQVAGTVDASGYLAGGIAGSSFTCSGGDVVRNPVISGGIVVGGECVSSGGAGTTLQQAYDSSLSPEITVNSSNGAFTVQDSSPALGANLFEVQSNGGGVKYFAVSAAGASVAGNLNITGQYRVNGVQLASADLLDSSNIAKLNVTQTFSAVNTFSNASNSFTGSGAGLTSLNGSNVTSGTVADARLSANVALLNGTGPQTFTGNNKFSGTVLAQNTANSTTAFSIQNALGNEVLLVDTSGSRVALGKASTLTGNLTFYNSGGAGNISLQAASPGASTFAITLPAASGTVCLTSGNCAGVGGTGDILNNGNTFGSAVTLGTNDSFGLNLEVNNTTVASFTNIGAVLFKNSSDSTTAFQIQNALGTSNLLIADTTNSKIGIGLAPSPTGATLQVSGTINASTGYVVAGTSGSSVTCTSGNVVQNAVVSGGITTGGSCVANGGAPTTLQTAYDNSSSPATITTSSSAKGIIFKAGATFDSTSLFQIQNAGGAQLFGVDTSNTQLALARSVFSGNILPVTAATITTTTTTTTTIADANAVGYYTSIAIGSDGLPVISYMDATLSDLAVTKCGNAACSSGNTTTKIADANAVGEDTSIAIGSDGLPVISYFDRTANDLAVTKCGNAACSSGNITTKISDANNIGQYTSIAIGSDGLPVISFYNLSLGDLAITKCGNASCSSGNTTTKIADANDVGYYTSIAIGSDGLPVISHQDGTAGDLAITKCGNASCSSGNTTTKIADANAVGENSSIAIGSDGLPVISHEDRTLFDLAVTKCTNISCSTNTTTKIADANVVGFYTSIAIGSDGLPVISYKDETATDLAITKCGNASCSSGNTTTKIANANNVGLETSIAIGTDGLPVISYRDSTLNDLVITKCGNASCSGSSSVLSGGISLGSEGVGFQSAYIGSIKTSDAVNPFTIATNGIDRVKVAGDGLTTLTGQILAKNITDSTTAFQIQNATGTSLLIADTANLKITLGSASSTPVILVLGNKNTVGDPTCTDGGIYYNSNSTQLRGCVNGAWNTIAGDNVVTTVPTTNLYDGRKIRLKAGTSPFEFVELTYDAGYAKWVSQPWRIGTFGVNTITTSSATEVLGDDFAAGGISSFKALYDAGLRPQFNFQAETWGGATKTVRFALIDLAEGGDFTTAATLGNITWSLGSEGVNGYYHQLAWTQPALTAPTNPSAVIRTYLTSGTAATTVYVSRLMAQVRWVSP